MNANCVKDIWGGFDLQRKYNRIVHELCENPCNVNFDIEKQLFQVYFYDNMGKGSKAKTYFKNYIKEQGLEYTTNHNSVFLTIDEFRKWLDILKEDNKL